MENRRRGWLARWATVALAATLSMTFGSNLRSQTQTGQIGGTVRSADTAALPGVTVTVSSPALQGTRSAVSDGDGRYTIPGLPPGAYAVEFALSGFSTVKKSVTVPLGGLAEADAELSVQAFEETITVTAPDEASILTTPEVATTLKYEDTVDKLSIGRTLNAIADLAPGITDNSPNLGQVTISGAFAYDNVFLLNGVDINDNLFGATNDLFIEDAIQETTVHTSGISAEYGRFSGGVISAVTKSGGNTFTGSFRTDFTNPSWRSKTLFQEQGDAELVDTTNKVYTGTLGGPILRDKLWFFGAYRREDASENRNLSVTGRPYEFKERNRRYEGKLTGQIAPNHTLQANYIRTEADFTDAPSINREFSIDDKTLVNPSNPTDLIVGRYDGVLSPHLFLEAQFSRKTFKFVDSGGTGSDIARNSPILALGLSDVPQFSHYNAPYFDAGDPEERNNRQFSAALSYFASTGVGRHDIKVGGEHYTSTNTGGNSQSPTGYVFDADPLFLNGTVQRDANGNVIPVFTPGANLLETYLAVRGARIDVKTLSFYLNDRWQLDRHWTFNLGVRGERHSTKSSQGAVASISSTSIAPRLGTTFDVKGDGRWILQGTYGHYAGKASEIQFGANTNVGNPNFLLGVYTGPQGQGVDFAPGFDPDNYETVFGSFPVSNVFVDSGLNTPTTKEWTLSAGTRLGNTGEIKAVYVNRHLTDAIEDFITLDGGTTQVIENGIDFGTFDNIHIRNSDLNERRYQALLLTGQYQVTPSFTVGGNWTVQLKNEANFEGEARNNPASPSLLGDNPEVFTAERTFPIGRTDDFQRHKARLWSIYNFQLGRGGVLSLGGLFRLDSGLAFSHAASNVALSDIQVARGAGYANLPSAQPLFFGGRGTGTFEGSTLFDFTVNYELPIYKTARPFVKLELRNAFNQQPLIAFNTTISPDPNSPLDASGLPTGFIRGPLFGRVTSNSDSPIPREFLASVGFRF